MLECLKILQSDIHYEFSEVKFLITALTHSSYANETGSPSGHNERLEFLGDAVLELSVSDELFQRFPDAPEGMLTLLRSRLVSETSLSAVAKRLNLASYILLGKGEENQGGRERGSLASDALEAVLGAVYKDGGFDAAREVVRGFFEGHWPSEPAAPKVKDYKSRLQEHTQRVYKSRPVYALTRSFGPEHEKQFEVSLTLPDGEEIKAIGASVKKAEQKAARKALEALRASDGGETDF